MPDSAPPRGSSAGDAVLPSNPDENESPSVLGATITTTALAFIFVVLRIWVRVGVIRNFGWDDAFMTLAMALSLAGLGVIIGQVLHGGGQHIGDVDPKVYSIGMKLNFISQPIYLWAICVVKLSIGCSLLRIASTKFWRVLILSIQCFMGLYTLGCFFTLLFQCTDIRALWVQEIMLDPNNSCWGIETLQALSYTNVTLNILTDLLFALVIPIPMLWKLKIPSRTRAVLVFVLGLGVFVCVAACIKIPYLINYGVMGDWLWDSRSITIWTVNESNVGILAGSIPTLRPLFKSFFGSIYGSGSKATPGPSRYYPSSGRGGAGGSKNNWQAFLSGGDGQQKSLGNYLPDEASSERAFNTAVGNDDYELGGMEGKDSRGVHVTTTISVHPNNTSDDSLDEVMRGTPYAGRKTTETRVEVMNSEQNRRHAS